MIAEAGLCVTLPVRLPPAVVIALAVADAKEDFEGDAEEVEFGSPFTKAPPATWLGVVLFEIFAAAVTYPSSVFPEDLLSLLSVHILNQAANVGEHARWVDDTSHPSLAMANLRTVEPYRVCVIDSDYKRLW